MNKKYNFIDNKPLGKDLFEGQSQERTSNVISNIIKDDTFQVIGIDGGWGVGKSNLVKIVEDKLSDHIFFIYDVWGHQEDEQRRSLLIELTNYLTDKENNLIKKGKWKKKLNELLSKKKEVTTENLPYLSVGFIFTLFAIVYSSTVTTFRGELDDWLNIESVFWKIVLVLSPIFIVIGIYFWNFFANWFSGNGFWASFKLSAQETFQIYTNKQKKETKIESISEEEPSVKDFQEWMTEIDGDLNKNLVLVLDNFDRLPKKHILNVWSSIHVFFADKQYKKIKVIIPFDRKHIKHAFSEFNGASNANYADDYINKTFDIVFRVAPPIMSSWKDFFRKNWETAFTTFNDDEFERVEQAYEVLNSTITPREIVAFINKFISIKLIDDKVPDRYIAIYLLCQEKILDNPLTAITELNYLKGLEPVYKNDEDYQKYITALAYQINSDNALEVIYKNRLRDCLVNNKIEEFKEIQELPAFKHIIKPVIDELEDYRNPILVLDTLAENEKITTSLKSWIWNIIHIKLKSNTLNLGTVEQYQLILLKNLTSTKQKTWLKNILNSLWLESEDIEIVDYIDNIDKIVDFCSEYELSIKTIDSLIPKNISSEKLKSVIDYKKEDYKKYKLNCEIEKIDDYLITIEAENLDETSFVEYLDNSVSLSKFHQKLLEFINSNKTDGAILFQILEKLKLTTNKKLELKSKITDADIHHLLSSATIKDDIYVDLAALRLSLLSSSSASYRTVYQKVLNSEDEEFHKKVAEQLEWYINYNDFLVGSATFTNNLMIGVANQLIQIKPINRTLIVEPILENIIAICDKNKIETEDTLNTLQVEETHVLNKERLLKLEPSVLLILKDSTSNIASKVIEIFNNYYGQRSKEEWEDIFNDLNDKLFLQLKTIDFVNWNPFALEVFNSLLLKIADDSIVHNNEIISWLINSFENSERDLDNTLINMRDRLIRNNNVTEEVFTLFIMPLLKHASLDDKANDVVRTVFKTELLDSDECVKLMLENSDKLKIILSKSGKSKNDFRDGLKARISKKEIQELSEALGFKIKTETDESNEE